MNHHLRFPRQSALLSSAIVCALAFPSCSTNRITPLAAIPDKEITYEVQIFDVPADHPFGDRNREILNAAGGAKLIKLLKNAPTFSATTGGGNGEKKSLSNKKKFVYPTKYSPIEFAKPGSSSFPVTPPTPTHFATTETGTTISVRGQQTQAEFINLEIELDRKILLGFHNHGKPITTDATDFLGRTVPIILTENRIEKPLFHTDKVKTTALIRQGNYLVIRNTEVMPIKPSKYPFTAKRPARFIALIRIKTRDPLE